MGWEKMMHTEHQQYQWAGRGETGLVEAGLLVTGTCWAGPGWPWPILPVLPTGQCSVPLSFTAITAG